jgi:hypothetical protein
MFYRNINTIGWTFIIIISSSVIVSIWNIIKIEYHSTFLSSITTDITTLKSKSSCSCYELISPVPLTEDKFAKSPFNIICEFENIILHEQKLYIDQSHCGLYAINEVSEWTNQKRLALRQQIVDKIPIEQIVIQPVLEKEWTGAKSNISFIILKINCKI